MESPRLPPLSPHAWLRFDAVQRLLPSDVHRVLEIGAGQGSVGALLARRYSYIGLEPDANSFAVAARRIGSDKVVCTDDESYSSAQLFDLVCAFEVLEHLEDDRGALERWQRFLRPGGWVLVSVPAGRDRVGAADRRAGHLRRYDRADVEAVFAGAGLSETAIAAYGFPLGYALEAGRNVLAARDKSDSTHNERTSASGRWLQPPDTAARLTQVLAAPFRLLQRPFGGTSRGTGLVARGRRPSTA
jgi:SAM-dependent methyltransferase